MKIRRTAALLAIPLLALFASACAAGPDTSDRATPTDEPITVQIVNDVTPATTVTVEVVQTRSDQRTLLGTVQSGESQTFSYDPEGLTSDRYQLVATTTDGQEIESRDFSLTNMSLLGWNVSVNAVSTGESGG